MANIAIDVQNVSKVYPLYRKHRDRMLEAIHPLRKKYHQDYYALDDVSFVAKKGEAIGIIGQNGSGKSTLLKLITGVLTPTSGKISVNGRISSLLELGTGFNPEMTGIENVFFYGTINALRREEIQKRLDDILAFADIGEFVYQPVKTYSSGMFVRLAFACAIHIDPDILIVDEALSVGDQLFQAKCMRAMEQLRAKHTTLLLVSHDQNLISRFCDQALYLKQGKTLVFGRAPKVAEQYWNETLLGENARSDSKDVENLKSAGHDRSNSHDLSLKVEILKGEVLDELGQPVSTVDFDQKVVFRIYVRINEEVSRLNISFNLYNSYQSVLLAGYTFHIAESFEKTYRKGEVFYVDFGLNTPLKAGRYSISACANTFTVIRDGLRLATRDASFFDWINDLFTIHVNPRNSAPLVSELELPFSVRFTSMEPA